MALGSLTDGEEEAEVACVYIVHVRVCACVSMCLGVRTLYIEAFCYI